MLIKHIKSGLWRTANRLRYVEDAQCLKVNVVLSQLSRVCDMLTVVELTLLLTDTVGLCEGHKRLRERLSILPTLAEIRLGVSMILQTWTSRHTGKVSE